MINLSVVCKALGLYNGVEDLPTNQKKILEVYKKKACHKDL
jgi:hypothetical protein